MISINFLNYNKIICLCFVECKNGTYGYNCANNCSGHCLNDSPCNKQTGHCDLGCTPGYYKNKCSEGFGFFYNSDGCIFYFYSPDVLRFSKNAILT